MLSGLIVPGALLITLLTAACRRMPAYDLFVDGAREGIGVAVRVLPNLAAMLMAVELMRASGLMDALCGLAAPVFEWLGLPGEVAPLVLLRPMSGSASLAMVEKLLAKYGADSRVGLIASTVMGSSETIFYTVCVYMSAVDRKATGYAVPCSLLGALAGTVLAGALFR